MTSETRIQSIKSILNKEWNPIGLDLSDDDDEYERYAKNIASREWSEKELHAYLTQAENNNLGLTVDAARTIKIAGAVRNIMRIIVS